MGYMRNRPLVPRRSRRRLSGLALLVTFLSCDNTPKPPEVDVPSPSQPTEPTTVPASTDSTPAPAKLSIEDVAKVPPPGTAIPLSVQYSPDGTLTYLYSPGNTLVQELFVHDLATSQRNVAFAAPEGGATEENLSPEEKLRRERLRMRSLGVTQYSWAKHANRFVVPLRGDLWVQDGVGASPRKIVDTDDSPAMDPKFSRDGDRLSYVVDGQVFVIPVEGGEPLQLTPKTDGTTYGVAEYIAQEEMDRFAGTWWSYSGKYIAYQAVDESDIDTFQIAHSGREVPSHEDHRYPFAGTTNAKVELWVTQTDGAGTPVKLDLNVTEIAPAGHPYDLYLARVHAMPDDTFFVEVENRAQNRLDLIRFDATGQAQLILSETQDPWINLHHLFEPLEPDAGELAGGFVWGSERSGFMHLYLYDAAGHEVRALTSGDWMVDSLQGVDVKNGWVYFSGTQTDATEQHLYRVPLAGGDIEQLTQGAGVHAIRMNRDYTQFVDLWSELSKPPVIRVFALTNDKAPTPVGDIPVETDPRVSELDLSPPELVKLKTRDGIELRGAIYKPQGQGPFPTIVEVYGGPHAQRVQNRWRMTVDMRAQYFRELGFLVFELDNRGSARRGLAFEGAIHRNMGDLEVQDQVDGVQWLVEQGLADPARVGIYGWSYGGYMSAMALARAPETFKVAVAGAPVTHWDGYDTYYTERYMGTPENNAEGYRSSSVMAHVDGLKGKLMLVHGLIDENVHFRHTARLINALIKARKDYELLLFPDERHMPRSEQDRVYMESRIRDFFVQNL